MGTTPPDLRDVIWSRYRRLLDIKRRIFVMRAFVDELERVTHKKPFRIRNGIVWRMLLDMRDMCVIDLYSWTVDARHGIPSPSQKKKKLKKRGMFIELRDHYLSSLTRTHTPHPGDNENEQDAECRDRSARFSALFPHCSGDAPTAADIEALCETFRLDMCELGTDRNKNRAHALEGDVGKAPMLSVEKQEAIFKRIEDMLESLSLVSDGPGFSRDDLNGGDKTETIADLVDQVVFGNIHDVNRLCAQRTRDELYARIHEVHDAQPPRGPAQRSPEYFNDQQFGPPFVEHVVRAATEADLRSGRRTI